MKGLCPQRASLRCAEASGRSNRSSKPKASLALELSLELALLVMEARLSLALLVMGAVRRVKVRLLALRWRRLFWD
jgi:hypothetical protein